MLDKVAVIGAGSWGTTVAAIASRSAPTVLWARRADVADAIDRRHENPDYLPGVMLPETLRATTSLEEAVDGAALVVMAVPSHGFRAVLIDLAPHAGAGRPRAQSGQGLRTGDQSAHDRGRRPGHARPPRRRPHRPEPGARGGHRSTGGHRGGHDRRGHRPPGPGAPAHRHLSRLHQSRSHRLRDGRGHQERPRHRRRHDPGSRSRGLVPGGTHHPGPGRARPVRSGPRG